jgi:hypothetical protein
VRRISCRPCVVVDKSPLEHSSDDISSFLATLDRLKTLALRGNEQALDILWMTGVEAGWCLANIEANGKPEMKQALRTLATRRMGWPVVATYLDGPEEIRRLTRSIHLSEKLPYDLRSQVRMDQLAKLAYELIEHIEEAGATWKARRKGETSDTRLPMYYRVASCLPPFSRTSLPRWWAVASKVFDLRFPNPDKVPWMRELVRNGASASKVRTIVKRRLRQKLAGLAPRG